MSTGTTYVNDVGRGQNLISYADGFRYQGQWSSGTSYSVGDVVEYSNASYVARTAHSGQTPFSGSSYWQTISAAGTVRLAVLALLVLRDRKVRKVLLVQQVQLFLTVLVIRKESLVLTVTSI